MTRHRTHCPHCGQRLRRCPICGQEVEPTNGNIAQHHDGINKDCQAAGLPYQHTIAPRQGGAA